MDTQELRAVLERELGERVGEVRFFQNQVALTRSGSEADMLRRALILLLYAHFEGFVKFALDAYISVVNAEKLKCADVASAVAAASMTDIFKELRNPQPASHLFRGPVPEDQALMRFARERHFIEQFYELFERHAQIPDYVLETESNLRISVLRKLLYRIGLEPTLFDEYASTIEELVSRRNLIAHGADRTGVPEPSYTRVRDAVIKVLTGVIRVITAAVSSRAYMRGDVEPR